MSATRCDAEDYRQQLEASRSSLTPNQLKKRRKKLAKLFKHSATDLEGTQGGDTKDGIDNLEGSKGSKKRKQRAAVRTQGVWTKRRRRFLVRQIKYLRSLVLPLPSQNLLHDDGKNIPKHIHFDEPDSDATHPSVSHDKHGVGSTNAQHGPEFPGPSWRFTLDGKPWANALSVGLSNVHPSVLRLNPLLYHGGTAGSSTSSPAHRHMPPYQTDLRYQQPWRSPHFPAWHSATAMPCFGVESLPSTAQQAIPVPNVLPWEPVLHSTACMPSSCSEATVVPGHGATADHCAVAAPALPTAQAQHGPASSLLDKQPTMKDSSKHTGRHGSKHAAAETTSQSTCDDVTALHVADGIFAAATSHRFGITDTSHISRLKAIAPGEPPAAAAQPPTTAMAAAGQPPAADDAAAAAALICAVRQQAPYGASMQFRLPCYHNMSAMATMVVQYDSMATAQRAVCRCDLSPPAMVLTQHMENEEGSDAMVAGNGGTSHKAQQPVYIYGNYHRYYGYRGGGEGGGDARMEVMQSSWFRGRRCLDVGCNEGVLTLHIAAQFATKTMTGVDIDEALVKKACTNLRRLRKDLVDRMQSRQTCPNLGLTSMRDVGKACKALASVWFEHQDWCNAADSRRQSVDTVTCFSVTKWIHLNWGDDGIRRLFRKFWRVLATGGLLILEPQMWRSYKSALRKQDMSAAPYHNLDDLQLRPDAFVQYLTHDIGFKLLHELHVGSCSKGFDRPLYVLEKPAPSTE